MEDRFQIDRFAVQNFRGIQNCDVELEPLTFFIGANASGKTSFVDAMYFVSSAVGISLDLAITLRGGLDSILHRPASPPANAAFSLYLSSRAGMRAEFHLELRIGRLPLIREECRIQTAGGIYHHYEVNDGKVTGSAAVFPSVSADRVFLANASGLPEFRPIFDFISNLRLTEPASPSMHRLVDIASRTISTRLPMDFAVRVRDLERTQPDRLQIVQQYLRAIAPPFDHLEVQEEQGERLSLRLVDKSNGGAPMSFRVSQVSAGLISSADILLELFELPEGKSPSPIIIEEPEAFLHPAAIQVIRDAFIEASRSRQVLVTTHSPDLLDDPAIPPEWIRSVYRDETGTHIEALTPETRSIIRDHLFTPGELLRQGGLI